MGGGVFSVLTEVQNFTKRPTIPQKHPPTTKHHPNPTKLGGGKIRATNEPQARGGWAQRRGIGCGGCWDDIVPPTAVAQSMIKGGILKGGNVP